TDRVSRTANAHTPSGSSHARNQNSASPSHHSNGTSAANGDIVASSNGKSSGSVGPELPRSEQSSEEEEELPKKELPKLESERAELPPASAPPDKLATKPKSSQHRVLKIVATVANKSRVQTPNGYIYQFELVLHEATGLSIKWQSVSARKISFAGKSSPV